MINMCNGCKHIVHLEQKWNIDPKDKEAWEGVGIDGRNITALCFGIGSVVTKSYEENVEEQKIWIIIIGPIVLEQYRLSNGLKLTLTDFYIKRNWGLFAEFLAVAFKETMDLTMSSATLMMDKECCSLEQQKWRADIHSDLRICNSICYH